MISFDCFLSRSDFFYCCMLLKIMLSCTKQGIKNTEGEKMHVRIVPMAAEHLDEVAELEN